MLELILAFLLCAVVGKIADSENLSAIVWGCATFVVVILCMAIPLPYLRLGVALVVMFVLLMLYKMYAKV